MSAVLDKEVSIIVRTPIALAVLASIVGSASAAMPSIVDVSGFAGADLVRIIGNSTAGTERDTRDVASQQQIETLYRFVASQTNGWRRVQFDAPLLRWKVEFIRDGKTLGSYGVGANFIESYDYVLTLRPDQQKLVEQLLATDPASTR